jgi:hypothetical protein
MDEWTSVSTYYDITLSSVTALINYLRISLFFLLNSFPNCGYFDGNSDPRVPPTHCVENVVSSKGPTSKSYKILVP